MSYYLHKISNLILISIFFIWWIVIRIIELPVRMDVFNNRSMKKVRFETPVKPILVSAMNESECHSPRPFIHKQIKSAPHVEYLDYQPVPFTNDPVQRFECGNSSPYPVVSRTSLSHTAKLEHRWEPSNDLDLSILDSALSSRAIQQPIQTEHAFNAQPICSNLKTNLLTEKTSNVLTPMENKIALNPPNVLRKNDDFFLRRDNLNGYKQLNSENHELQLDKENNPLLKKTQMMMMGQSSLPVKNVDSLSFSNSSSSTDNSPCRCHHCVKVCKAQHIGQSRVEIVKNQNINRNSYNVCHCITRLPQNHTLCPCNMQPRPQVPTCNCNNTPNVLGPLSANVVDKKTWAIQRYAQNENTECLDLEKQTNITMNEKEPTVADLFKIIKMQNDQLQQLQEKVDKFISNSNNGHITNPAVQNYMAEQVALESCSSEQKISIGVMTSFEVVRTSTIINKEFVKQNEAQIQCNRSQISIKEVVSQQPANSNFLDGLTPVSKHVDIQQQSKSNTAVGNGNMTNNFNDEKTLNEMSLYNVQVDNAITPNISPEQSLYLDVRDYSDSDASSDEQSNVGWTYYNKVMTHVNGMLQESDMPSSASALYRNVRQKCMQMQIDKSNVSVAKRVTFGDDPLGLQKPYYGQQAASPTTDTSLKMKQLAAKYLKNGVAIDNTPSPRPVAMPVDMSLATRNYMEKHRILKGPNVAGHPQLDIPKFLDITALKQQPKFL